MISSVCVVGTDPTMVHDELHRQIAAALDGLDPATALEDFTAGAGEDVLARVVEALHTPPFLVDHRVVVLREAQSLSRDAADELLAWMASPTPAAVLVVGVVGARSAALARGAQSTIETAVGTRATDRAAYVQGRFGDYGLVVEMVAARAVADALGDDMARVDALARTCLAVYGPGPRRLEEIAPYVGDAGDVPEWDLTDAIERGDLPAALAVARRMLGSGARSGLQVISALQRYVLRLARLDGAGLSRPEEAASLLGISAYPAGKALATSHRLGGSRIAEAVHLVARADLDLKGGATFGSRGETGDADATDLTVIEVLVARLARLVGARPGSAASSRRRRSAGR